MASSVTSDRAGRAALVGPMILWLLLALPAMAIGFHRLANNDLPMHLAIGEWVLEHGEVPDSDPFSFTAPEGTWVPHEWLAGVLFAWLEGIGGAHILVVVAVVLSGVLAVLAAAAARELDMRPREVLLWSLPVWLMAGRRLMLRPHLIALSLVFLAWWVVLVGRRRPLLLWLLPVILVVWVNVHGSFPLGFGICVLGLLFLPEHTAGWRVRGGVLLACTGALFLQPHGIDGLLAPLRLTSDPVFMSAIQEWARPFGDGVRSEIFRATPNFALSLPWLALVVWGLWRSPRRVPLAYQLFVFGCLILYVRHQRYLALFVLARMPCLPFELWRPTWPERWRRTLPGGMAAGTALLVLAFGYPATWTSLRKAGSGWATNLPMAEAELVVKSGYTGPVLCEYEFGGMVAWQGHGELQVSLDSRNSVYGSELLLRHHAAFDGAAEGLAYRELLIRQCGAAIIRNPLRDRRRLGLFWRLDRDDAWEYMQLTRVGAMRYPLKLQDLDDDGDGTVLTTMLADSASLLFLRKEHLETLRRRIREVQKQLRSGGPDHKKIYDSMKKVDGDR